MDDRSRALADIAALARQHGLTVTEIAAVLGEPPAAAAESRWRAVVVRTLGFLGGIFIFAGIGIFVALQWDQLNFAARVIVTLGSGVAAFALAVLASQDARFDKATTPLFLVASALEPTGMLVAFEEFGSGGDWRWAGLATAGVMAGQLGATFAFLRRSTLLFMTVLFATLFWLTAFDLLNLDEKPMAMVIGGSLLLTAIGVDRTPHRDITPSWYLAGAAAFLYGLWDAVEGTSFEILFLAVASGFVYLAAVVHSRTLLFVSTLAILAFTAWYTGEHFAQSIGWPIALIAFGLVMIGLGALAVRIDRDYVRTSGR